jgi:hypothetical protein
MKIMRKIAIAAALTGLAVASAHAQTATVSSSGNVCLKTILIDHTKTVDQHTILFYMKDHKVWRNTLASDCQGLLVNGFVYMPTPPDQVCGNFQVIRAIETKSVCTLGAFTPADDATMNSHGMEQSAPPPPPPDMPPPDHQ